jgi:hypothetical protein
MDVSGNLQPDSVVEKERQEVVQKQKREYKFLISYLRTRGLNLYSYNHHTDEVNRIEILRGNTIHCVPLDGVLVPIDYEMEKSLVDPRHVFFEALNDKNAKKRVENWKGGKITELCNLVEPSKDGIKFW